MFLIYIVYRVELIFGYKLYVQEASYKVKDAFYKGEDALISARRIKHKTCVPYHKFNSQLRPRNTHSTRSASGAANMAGGSTVTASAILSCV